MHNKGYQIRYSLFRRWQKYQWKKLWKIFSTWFHTTRSANYGILHMYENISMLSTYILCIPVYWNCIYIHILYQHFGVCYCAVRNSISLLSLQYCYKQISSCNAKPTALSTIKRRYPKLQNTTNLNTGTSSRRNLTDCMKTASHNADKRCMPPTHAFKHSWTNHSL